MLLTASADDPVDEFRRSASVGQRLAIYSGLIVIMRVGAKTYVAQITQDESGPLLAFTIGAFQSVQAEAKSTTF